MAPSAQCCKVCLTPTTRVPCSNAANIGEHKTWTHSECCTWQNSVRGQEPPEMYIWCTSPGDGQRLCKVWLASGERRQCSNEAKKRKQLKLVGVPQTPETISAVSGSSPNCENMWRTYCCLTSSFRIVDICFSCEDTARRSCAMVCRWRFFASFLRPVFPASRMQHISDLHSKFALRPHHV